MRQITVFSLCVIAALLNGCATSNYTEDSRYAAYYNNPQPQQPRFASSEEYAARMPAHIASGGQKTVVVNPNVHAWGAYDKNGDLVKAGIATAGGDWCEDNGRPCRTNTGTFHIQRAGNESCKSSIYPKPKGGGLMPYCMFFSSDQALHGSPDNAVVEANISHGCVRMRIPDAEWLRNDFASIGTKVVVQPYDTPLTEALRKRDTDMQAQAFNTSNDSFTSNSDGSMSYNDSL